MFSLVLPIGSASEGAQATNVPGVQNKWVVHSWQTEQGLPQNTVNAVLQTRDGFLWVGTSGGLTRFDGMRFRKFGLQDGLRSVQIFRLAEGRDGTLWIGTVGGGVSRWENGRFISYGAEEGFPDSIVQALLVDRDGSLWIGTERGLIKWSGGKFAQMGPAEGLPKKSIRALTQDSDGTVWVGTLGAGVFRGTNGYFTVTETNGAAPHSVYSFIQDRDGSMWTGYGNGDLWRWRNGKWKHFSRTNGLPAKSFESLAQLPDGIWITAEDQGLYRFNGETFSRLPESREFATTKADCLTVDREGSIWVGTSSEGLYRLSPPLLQYWTTSPRVMTLTEDGSGSVWAGMGTEARELKGGQFHRSTNGSPRNPIYSSATTSDGTAWMAGESFLFRLPPGKPADKFTNEPVAHEAIRALCADGEKLWIGTYYSTLLKWESNAVHVVATNGAFGSDITSLAREGEDKLWVGTSSGLFQWDHGTIRKWTTSNALLTPNIRALHRDSDGTLWIGTLGGGLVHVKDGHIASITSRDGLIDDVISQILLDDPGHLWLGCNHGLMRLNRLEIDAFLQGHISQVRPMVFGRNEGLLKEQCTGGHSPTALKTKDGRLLFPTVGGVAEVDPRMLQHLTVHEPQARIDQVVLDGQNKSLHAPLIIPPGKHRLAIDYTAPTLLSGSWLRFRYRLEGLDSQWVMAGTRRTAAYEALAPSDYVFRVAVQNSEGGWNELSPSLAFVVQPFFWQTFWFRSGTMLLLAAASAGLVARIAANRRRRERREFGRARNQSAALLTLSVNPGVTAGDLPSAFREICETAARTLSLARVGVWLFDENERVLRCANVFDSATQEHGQGDFLSVSGAPRYVDTLQKERVVVVRDARNDPQTNELSERHFARRHVASVLDAPVRLSGKLAAIIRFEHIGQPRDWRGDEITFAGNIGDQVARALLNAERESANQQVRESEARFRALANAATVMIWVTGPDKLCTFLNKSWIEFTGRTLEQELGNGWADGVHPDDFSACLKTYEDSFEARREFTMEYRLRNKNGQYSWVLDTGAPRFTADGVFAGYVGSATDITVLKQAEERWRIVVESAPDAMLVVNTEGKITLVNARVEKVFGYKREELIGQRVEILIPETLRARHPDVRERYMANPTERSMQVPGELFGRRKDGSHVPVEIGLNPIHTEEGRFVLASIVDITERLAAEAELRESEKRMTLAADAANLGMWVWDAPDTYIWTSAKWKEVYGYGPNEELRFDALIERVHPEDREAVDRAIVDAFNEYGAFHLQHRLLLPSGSVRWISTSGRVEQISDDGPLQLMGISIDITERKQIEEAAREVSGKLITAQEDERRRIARDLHDDLNQRLAMLSVQTDLLGHMENSPPAQAIIADIASHVQNLSSEVHKLSYQLHPAKLDQLGLVAAARSFCQEVSKQCRLPVEFMHEGVPRDLESSVALCLYRIIQEALQNVIKHSGASRARVELCRREDTIDLKVSDDGRGFEMAVIGHQAGLGLLGMRERVRLMHGQIVFHSAPNDGTKIEVSVPLGAREPVFA